MSIVPLSSIPPAVPFERRRARRIQLQIAIELDLDGEKRIGRIVEMSRTGARITTEGARAGQSVILRRAGVEVHGQVVWTNGSLAGLRFPVPIDENRFVKLRKRTAD
jgi:PilZ domain